MNIPHVQGGSSLGGFAHRIPRVCLYCAQSAFANGFRGFGGTCVRNRQASFDHASQWRCACVVVSLIRMFTKVETPVDFPAEERAILAALGQNPGVREAPRQESRASRSGRFSTAHHRQQSDGRASRVGPNLQGRLSADYFAMTGHELRYQNGFDCQGLVGRGRGRERAEAAIEARHRGSGARRQVQEHRFLRRQSARSASTPSRAGRRSNRSASAVDELGPHRRRLGQAAGRAQIAISRWRSENNYTIWSFLKKCHERKLIYKSYDAMPWCGRCGTGISQQEMNEGYQLVAHRSVFVKFPLR